METLFDASYQTKKKLAIFILKNRALELCDFFLEEKFDLDKIEHLLFSIESDQIDQSEIDKYCFVKKRTKEQDSQLSDICGILKISYYISLDYPEIIFNIFSSDGNLSTKYESTDFDSAICCGIFCDILNKELNYNKVIELVRDNFPDPGEYDLTINSYT